MRYSQIQYFFGMMLGILLVYGTIFLSDYGVDLENRPEFLVAFVAGATGAVISVLTRMTKEDLKLDPYVGKMLLLLFGVFRVIIGTIFGLFVYGMIESGILNVKVPTGEPEESIAFVAIFAFAAGFAARRAKGIVESLAPKLVANKQTEKS